MAENEIDSRFCKVALDGLKTYRHRGFTVQFIKKNDIPSDGNTLAEMWDDIEKWLAQGIVSRCKKLLDYVDSLKLWGRQRIFLFEIENYNQGFREQLHYLDVMDKLLNKPVYDWDTEEPFIASISEDTNPHTNAPILVFKIIEMRKYDVLSNGAMVPHVERTTNFFIINLQEGFAELRLQKMPPRPEKSIKDEYLLFLDLLEESLGILFTNFLPIPMEKIMYTLIRIPVYSITSTIFKASRHENPDMPTLSIVLNRLFRHPMPNHIAAFWDCEQKLLGQSKLHFRLIGGNNSLAVGGVADPEKVSNIINDIFKIYNGTYIGKKESTWKKGWVDEGYNSLEGNPKAQAVILSAGAIAALIIWILIEGLGNYLFEEWVERILKGVPLVFITISIEIVWMLRYYGWNRIKTSFKVLFSMPVLQIWGLIRKSKKMDKKMVLKNN